MTTQGINPDTVFADLYPVLYAASIPIDGGYARMSDICAALADVYGGIAGRSVLDIGCGFGTTSVSIAAYAPGRIIAVDNSRPMIEFLDFVLLADRPIGAWLEERGAFTLLEEYFAPTLQHLEDMRRTFQHGVFQRRGGKLTSWIADGLRVAEFFEILGRVDFVIGNNYLHWPVNQRIAALKKEKPDLTADSAFVEACRDALRSLANLLPVGGIAVLMEPNDFVTLDEQPEQEADLDRNCLAGHSIFIRFHEAFNTILKQEYGIDRAVPKRTSLFRLGELPVLASVGGFQLRRVHHVEWTYPRVLDSIFVRLPLVLGGLKLPFEEKLKLGKRVRAEFAASLRPEELRAPIRSQWFFFVLARVS